MAISKKTILFIGGGWHPPKSYRKLAAALEALGFDVHVPAHPTMNESRPPNADLSTDTANIRSYAEDLLQDGREVIALMHSYGGQVGTNALHGLGITDRAKSGLTGGVSNLIYLAACAVPEGKSMIDMVRHHGHEELMSSAFDVADDMSCVCRDPKATFVGVDSGISDQEVEEYVSTFVRWNGNCMYQPITAGRAAWRDIPVTYIYAAKDMTIPLVYQTWFVEEMKKQGVEVQTATLDTGHCPNLTATTETAELVRKIAKGEVLHG
ncbi:alpha/beta-hydrolase [Cucurbitaria berberidis CBS 394.84]|uniref:Alpha/beta-hydrolase n=1 Tax=Cucurbitaria berberidis CBS 394.84 TaxID=1168544 RepID=A0A9P4LEK5_9PLEO|nr:alpha/beta-hydrolase [Cucurbitaria berberidis CBS 394.84]KAF1851452.1 alpha/beta-hydrolase [Cucurbitaria berberidis CBS 394.84]